METKNKNEEIQSRREFFKKAAKVALPVVGAIALANLPIANAEAQYGCLGCGQSCRGHVQVIVRQLVLEVVPVVVLAVAKEEYITNQNDNYIKT